MDSKNIQKVILVNPKKWHYPNPEIKFDSVMGWTIAQGPLTNSHKDLSKAIKVWNQFSFNDLEQMPIKDGELLEVQLDSVRGYKTALAAWIDHCDKIQQEEFEKRTAPDESGKGDLDRLLEAAERVFGQHGVDSHLPKPAKFGNLESPSPEIISFLKRAGWVQRDGETSYISYPKDFPEDSQESLNKAIRAKSLPAVISIVSDWIFGG